MPRPLRVYYNSLGTPEMYAMIAARMGEGLELVTLDTDDDAERKAKIAECEVAIVAAKPLTAEVISAAKKLELVHHQGVGYHDTVATDALAARGIRLALTPEGTTIGVAEHTVLLALGAARRAAFADAELRQGRWHVNALRPVSVELFDKTVGFIGFGRIGQEAARRFAAFGTRRLYHDPAVPASADLPAEPAAFDDVIAQSDILSLHLPLSDATSHLISAEVIGRMKPEAILVNTARGGIVDDAALASALADGRLLAAGLDVFEGEPIDPDNPFCGLPNVFLTPHISAGTRDALGHKMTALFANIDRFRNGDALANEVTLGTSSGA
ncbi:D-3-phosphoglycerate dehydrogenase [Aliiruegeria haliotis]|uniref:D-3-phosphoglycerate dehydrogenase n=1 Tax=Aliiruegeria haliotis TaxID=1280846 RepID=A0A2T0RLQ7_9RHOB|nr:NAD(P)-dependent oxidoreductase [Aliiruegeria haliotis]PRY22126.1 D-3-phosphoglycerate dehydrogenase [Aliiruegeria haliotis]